MKNLKTFRNRIFGQSEEIYEQYDRPKDFVLLNSAYVGFFNWGECESPILIKNIVDLAKYFGDPTDINIDDYLAVSNYLKYNSEIYVTRIVEKIIDDESDTVTHSGSENAYLGVKDSVTSGLVTDSAIKDLIINQDSYSIKKINGSFISFQSDEVIRFYARYPSPNKIIKIAMANYSDFSTANITSSKLFIDEFEYSIKSNEIAIVILDENDEILESHVVSKIINAKNNNGQNYYIDEWIFKNSEYVYTISDSIQLASKDPDSFQSTQLIGGNAIPLGGFENSYSDYGVSNVKTDFNNYFNHLYRYRFNLLIDSFLSSRKSIKMIYDNGIDPAVNFNVLKHHRVNKDADSLNSNQVVWEIFRFEFNNGDNSAPILDHFDIGNKIYMIINGVNRVGYIRGKIIDAPNNINIIFYEAPKNADSVTNIYIDESMTTLITFSTNASVHNGSDTFADCIKIHSGMIQYLNSTEFNVGILNVPNFYTIMTKDTAITYVNTLSAIDTCSNAVIFMESQNQNVPISLDVDGVNASTNSIIPSVGDIAGNWSNYEFTSIDNKNGLYYYVVPEGDINDEIKAIIELNRNMINSIKSVAYTMIDEHINNNKSKYAICRIFINKIKSEIDYIVNKIIIFDMISDSTLSDFGNSIIKFKSELLNTGIVENVIFDVNSILDDLDPKIEIKINLIFNNLIGSIKFNIIKNVSN